LKEREIPGLMELKFEYESKLVGIKDFQELKSEFERGTMVLIKEAMLTKGIKLDGGLSPGQGPQSLRANSCGFCEVCITACTDCVSYS
jgi:hypothetical protein